MWKALSRSDTHALSKLYSRGITSTCEWVRAMSLCHALPIHDLMLQCVEMSFCQFVSIEQKKHFYLKLRVVVRVPLRP